MGPGWLHYRVEAILGKSEFGIIYQAWDNEQTRRVEITLAHVKSSMAEETLTKLRTHLMGLQSPYISLLDLAEHQGRYLIVREYVQGETLRAYLDRNGLLSGDQAFPMLDQIASALEKAHARNLPHLGLKPANIVLTATGVKLIHYSEESLIVKLVPLCATVYAPYRPTDRPSS